MRLDAGFHPRFDAIAKTYQYTLFRAPVCPPFQWRYVHHHPYPLDEDAMIEAARLFEGEHDFTAFAASDNKDEEEKSRRSPDFPLRTQCAPANALIYTVRGSGFLKHMVRNIVGTLIETGRGNLDAQAIETCFSGDRGTKQGPPHRPKGLCCSRSNIQFILKSKIVHMLI